MKSDINLKHLAKLEVLPSGWAHSSVGELCIIEPVGNKKLAQKKYLEHGDYPVVDQGAAFIGGYSNEKDLVIDPPKNGAYLVFGDHSRAFKLIDFSFIPGADGVKVLKPVCVLPKWIYYFCQAIPLPNKGYARHFQYLKEAYLPLPPLSNQKPIVEKIEELFSHIDAGVEGLKQAKAKLQQYRQSVLKDAVTGKLTEQWRAQNADKLEPAEHFLKRILDERRANWEAEQLKAFEEKGKTPKNDKWKDKYKVVDPLTERDVAGLPLLPEGWCYAKLGQVIDDPKYGTSKKCTYDSKGKGVLRIPNIAAGEINPEDMKYAEFTDDEIATYKLNEGDILTIRSNGSVSLVGKCAVISDKDTDFLFAGYLIRLRPVLKHIDANYLKDVLTSGFLRKQIEMLAKSSSGVNNINTGELQSLIIPVCSLQEQRLIAQDIDSKNTVVNRQFEEYDRLFNQASKNKSAILKKAFSGELVENIETSESAEQLLGRIYEEKKLLEQKSRFAKKKPTARAKKMEKRPIIDVLKESNKALSVDDLFELAGFQKEVTPESIEEFYQELKTVAEAKFVEVSPILLGGKKQGDKFEYKEVKRK
ncbi:restriction endonuclease subunit S [Vibrio vulnificus]|nr:restriction endonuclease subunit S [Vibrio vulnificus]ELH0864192.1 restriction endonuclease subunit S [Vibrio vulnificus]MCU8119851.1 restriction endonuclease subunit S [Vibrio vulnificus]HAS8396582.1 restriction endonuclease subunit S [Vibrio vulnificus]